MDRKVDVANPAPPNIDIKRNPSEEQLAHVLESILNPDPDMKDLKLILNLECLIT